MHMHTGSLQGVIVTVPNPAASIFYLGGPPSTPGRMRLSYRDIVARDPCAYCGAPFEEVEHIDPRSRGGRDEWENLTSSCRACNRAKRDIPLLRFLGGYSEPRILRVLRPQAPELVPPAIDVEVGVPTEMVDALVPLAEASGYQVADFVSWALYAAVGEIEAACQRQRAA